jgi:hypothetical protein
MRKKAGRISCDKLLLTTEEKQIGTQAFAVRIRRIQNQTSTSQLATLLLLIPQNPAGRILFADS